MKMRLLSLSLCLGLITVARAELKVAPFDADVTPTVGQMLAYVPMVEVGELSQRARGYVLTGAGEPIVVCAVDWIGISNASHDAFRDALAEAAGTTRERVAVQVLHQHDAPGSDFTAAAILKKAGRDLGRHDPDITRLGIDRTAAAVKAAMKNLQPLTHISMGAAKVDKVASNRRVMGSDGKVIGVRTSATKKAELRAAPEGLIDPEVTVIGLWSGDLPIVVTSYYATQPMSYYLVGVATSDIPGIARLLREIALPGVLQVYFTGAAGNVTAGKYNDGAHENRPILAKRLADGMARAWENSKKEALSEAEVAWQVESVSLPTVERLDAAELQAEIDDASTQLKVYGVAASRLAFLQWNETGHPIDVTCLRMGSVRILHLPGEPFVEYQLAAKAMRPDLTVAMAGYGAGGTGYIPTAKAYGEGGYEEKVTRVGPGSEKILLDAIRKLLEVPAIK